MREQIIDRITREIPSISRVNAGHILDIIEDELEPITEDADASSDVAPSPPETVVEVVNVDEKGDDDDSENL